MAGATSSNFLFTSQMRHLLMDVEFVRRPVLYVGLFREPPNLDGTGGEEVPISECGVYVTNEYYKNGGGGPSANSWLMAMDAADPPPNPGWLPATNYARAMISVPHPDVLMDPPGPVVGPQQDLSNFAGIPWRLVASDDEGVGHDTMRHFSTLYTNDWPVPHETMPYWVGPDTSINLTFMNYNEVVFPIPLTDWGEIKAAGIFLYQGIPHINAIGDNAADTDPSVLEVTPGDKLLFVANLTSAKTIEEGDGAPKILTNQLRITRTDCSAGGGGTPDP